MNQNDTTTHSHRTHENHIYWFMLVSGLQFHLQPGEISFFGETFTATERTKFNSAFQPNKKRNERKIQFSCKMRLRSILTNIISSSEYPYVTKTRCSHNQSTNASLAKGGFYLLCCMSGHKHLYSELYIIIKLTRSYPYFPLA